MRIFGTLVGSCCIIADAVTAKLEGFFFGAPPPFMPNILFPYVPTPF